MAKIFKEANALYSILKGAELEEAEDLKSTVEDKFEIHIFDFDGTLFRSPLPPPLWKGGWWSKPESLNAPCVPEEPDESWWILDTVSQAKDSIANSNVFSALFTGRQESIYGDRVRSILGLVGLNFGMVKLSDSDNTKEFKSREIKGLLERYPLVNKLKIWDDRIGHLEYYKGVAIATNPKIEVETTLVSTYPMPAQCNAEDGTLPSDMPSRAGYIGLMLNSASKSLLLKNFPAKLDNTYADHVTLIFSPKKEHFANLWNYMGREYQIMVTGYAEDAGCQAVTVSMPDLDDEVINFVMEDLEKKGMADKKLHITLATGEGIPAKYSNDLLQSSEIRSADGPQLKGTLWWK